MWTIRGGPCPASSEAGTQRLRSANSVLCGRFSPSAGDTGFSQHRSRHADFPPGGIGDASTLRVLLGHLDEVALRQLVIGGRVERGKSSLGIQALLDQLHAASRVGLLVDVGLRRSIFAFGDWRSIGLPR